MESQAEGSPVVTRWADPVYNAFLSRPERYQSFTSVRYPLSARGRSLRSSRYNSCDCAFRSLTCQCFVRLCAVVSTTKWSRSERRQPRTYCAFVPCAGSPERTHPVRSTLSGILRLSPRRSILALKVRARPVTQRFRDGGLNRRDNLGSVPETAAKDFNSG